MDHQDYFVKTKSQLKELQGTEKKQKIYGLKFSKCDENYKPTEPKLTNHRHKILLKKQHEGTL